MKDGKFVILCVDDDQDFLDATRIMLEANGYIVATAQSAEDGLAKYHEVGPDLIIVDLMMEEVDAGVGLARDLKLAGNKAPVFMLSSVGDQLNTNIDYNTLGLDGLFQKPLNFELFIKTLQVKLGK
ncbi:MAG: response regulator [Proteobacteria bacterium]|jgi:DNA-binding response OmpR family regulator|nr:response regulator [Pseudomonadota bacterium]NLN62466.1 response regulator [Myxococcales bacterium]